MALSLPDAVASLHPLARQNDVVGRPDRRVGLIADVALLQNETRSLAKQGIEQLRNTNRIGLRLIAELAGASFDSLTEETIGFTFAPRLNALGRLGDANPAVELLITKDG